MKYAVYVVMIEDSNEAFDTLADAVAQYDGPIGLNDLEWDEAEAAMLSAKFEGA